MKKLAIIMTVIVALGAITLVIAQKPVRSFDGDKRAEQLKKELNLTDQQQQQLQILMTGFREEVKPIMQDESVTREQKQAKMKEFREKHQSEIKKILTEEQIIKFDELMANRPMRPEMGERPGRGDGQRGDNRERNGRGAKGMSDEDSQVFIYPNPANDVINVQFKNETAQPVKVELFSKSGVVHEVLLESTVPAGTQTYTFNIGHLSVSELYFIKTTVGQEITTVKLLKN